MRIVRCCVVTGAVLAAVGGARAGQPAPIEKLIEKQGKLCFARIYDVSHLKSHPRQKVERVFFMIGKNKASTYWEDPRLRHSETSPSKHDNPAEDVADRNSIHVAALFTLRGAKKPEQADGWCYSPTEDEPKARKLRCGGECDRSIGAIRTEDGSHLILDEVEPGVLLDPEAEEAGDKSRMLGSDDKAFRLDPRPLEDCVAEANKTNSRYADLGPPLRERLKADAPFCFGRDYTAQHLASHPQQLTAAIRVSRDQKQIAADRAKNLLADWPDGARVTISVATRANAKPAALRYVCTPFEDQWECTASLCKAGRADCTQEERDNSAAAACDQDESKTVYLRRARGEFMMLGNPNIGLPLDGSCGRSGKTASDDKLYRLDALPLAACAGR
jgi:hypothetical protein